MNQLYFGDNLHVLRDCLAAESVDLIYLDPPFNSKRDYNLLFKTPKAVTGGKRAVASVAEPTPGNDGALPSMEFSQSQITAFEDSWHWGPQAASEFEELLHQPNTDVSEMMQALRRFLGENDMMAYLTMMANRLLELHRVLKPTGSLYLHCDPTASHYLKIVLDGVFGKLNFRNEITWKRRVGTSSAVHESTRFGVITDVIFFYAKSDEALFHPQYNRDSADYQAYVEERFNLVDEHGRRFQADNLGNPAPRPNLMYEYKGYKPPKNGWAISKEKMEQWDREGRIYFPEDKTKRLRRKRFVDELKGMPVQNLWTDIPEINSQAEERLGYPTQKPLALLERIISASSNEGDVVLDPFCGCGTAVHAAQKLNRNWIGIDITHLAISLIEKRLKDSFGAKCKFEVHGTPKDHDAARDLATRDKYQFQWWAVSLVDAQPFQGKKKGADGGIDGLKFFHDVDKAGARKIVVSVKGGGNLKADDIRSLMAVRERESAEIALFISLEEPTRGMIADAASAGFYESATGKKYPRVQLLTIEGLLSGKQRTEHPDHQPDLNFKRAKQETQGKQKQLI